MVGVCFGHQVDGRGARRPCREIGQGLGRRAAPLCDRPRASRGWTAAATIAVPASHQDQVVVQPPNTEVVAASDFTPYRRARLDRPAGDLLPVPSRILAGIRQGADRAALRRRARSRRRHRLARRAQRQCARRRRGSARLPPTEKQRMKTRAAVAFARQAAARDRRGRPRRARRRAKCWSRSWRPASATPTPTRSTGSTAKASSRRSSAMKARASSARSGRA